MNTDQKPLGWYLKEVDALITNQMNTALKGKEINRFQWQLLTNLAKAGYIILNDFYPQVSRFVDRKELESLVEELGGKGWIATEDDQLRFTDAGCSAFKDIEAIQAKNRETIMRRINDEDYQITIKVLSQMVRNLSHQD